MWYTGSGLTSVAENVAKHFNAMLAMYVYFAEMTTIANIAIDWQGSSPAPSTNTETAFYPIDTRVSEEISDIECSRECSSCVF